MLINEIIKNNSNALNEGMMKYNEWKKDKYANPFIDKIIDGEEEPVNYIKDGEERVGIVLSNKENIKMARYLQSTLAGNPEAKELAPIYFMVDMLDEDENPTGNVEQVYLQEIVKDELMTGQLRVNLGNIAELVLGCAVTAKYEKQKAEVTADDVISVGARLAQGNGTVSSSSGKDAISFSASVPSADKKAWYAYVGEDPKGKSVQDYGIAPTVIKGINQHIASAVTYVNTSPRVLLAVDKVAADPGENEVEIMSDGGNAEQQKTTKVDLKITIDGTRLNLLSIKAGNVGQFGQVSGYEFEKLNSFFEQSVGMSLSPKTEKKFAKFNTSLKGKERISDRFAVRETNYNTGFKSAYDEIEKGLKALAKGDQVDLLERVYSGLLYHATRNEEGVEMVILSPNAKKAFSELTFGPELRKALDDYQLVVNRGQSAKMHILQVYGIPKTAKVKKAMGSANELLVQYRSYSQAKAVRNIIEMGKLLKELADWEKIEARRVDGQLVEPSKPAPLPPRAAQTPIATGAGTPSGMTNIQPASDTVSNPLDSQDDQSTDELNIIKRNAGITVE